MEFRMSSDVVIRAEGLGKKYIIGHQSTERVPTLRDAITRTVSNFARGASDMMRGRAIVGGDDLEEFWALKDVSFEIKRGDVVGIIGRNGAGKSPLLKVLSRITEPAEGRVEIKGRVASLLEVGTGFHGDLSGRENIYLNGSILGMSKAEIDARFDEIVAFSEVEQFLDTPVKRYSSGMYVRLAFAVAAHLEPEILIVDEVLAVGDAQFQKKCLGKMEEVSKGGRTVLFVSHNMAAIKELCERTILLSKGNLYMAGATEEVISHYYRATSIKSLDKVKVTIILNDESDFWEINECILILLENNGVDANLFLDIAFYDESRSKIFSIEGAKFDKTVTIGSNLKIKVKNPGIVNTTVFIDIGLKEHLLGSYVHIITNAAEIKTKYLPPSSPVNGRFLAEINIINE